MMHIDEGYFDCYPQRSHDCDHGPCTEYHVPELGIIFYLYDNKKYVVSFHEGDKHGRD